ncbi:MAG TPA: hypothetical protein DD490_20115 [Acidobacteria bacterium]|nr:hypothetical protein [Acidobacteriota bacterium]
MNRPHLGVLTVPCPFGGGGSGDRNSRAIRRDRGPYHGEQVPDHRERRPVHLDFVHGGVLGRAQREYPLEIVAYVVVSSHYHLLLRVDHAKQLSDFMCFFNANLAKEVARRIGWKEKVWGRRYQSIVISDEEEMQVARLRYCLAHGVKEGLVARVEEWPGVHCAVPLLTGAPVVGTWYDRSLEYNAFLRRKELEKGESQSREVVELSPLPAWQHLSAEAYRARIAVMVREINETAAAARAESLIAPLGADGVRAQNPETRPRKLKKSPAPFCHALRKKVRKALWEAYGLFVASFREAAEKLKAGDREAQFPPGSFPPRLPFVEA